MNTTAVIAEDEPLLLAQLKVKLARAWPALEIVAAVGDGEAALDAIAEHRPTFAFLDIQMPELTGIEVARRLARDPDARCHVVFVTAYDQYALEAFDAGAIDYLLKPYSDERLNATIQRLQARLSEANPTQDLQALMKKLAAGSGQQTTERLRFVKASIGDKLRLIPIDEVLFFQADEKYTLVATTESDALIRTPIRDLIDGLDPEKFWQIHRSAVVNAMSICSVTRDERGQATVHIKNRKESLVVSRPYSYLFKQM
ncbi:MAG: response regulator transcription factor [Rhodocyclaceae bacterium]|nr:response regulator transcription factor [Rhodocyclaceae bacterium]MBP6279042.1 response regulator transcription factor [Rhodocyclaceae bacterium]